MSDFMDKAKDMAGNAADKTKDLANSAAGKKVEDQAEAQAAKGGTLGSLADKADDAIDEVQGTKD
jgi:hypothetical protein